MCKWHSNTRPFGNRTTFNYLNTGFFQCSDPPWMLIKMPFENNVPPMEALSASRATPTLNNFWNRETAGVRRLGISWTSSLHRTSITRLQKRMTFTFKHLAKENLISKKISLDVQPFGAHQNCLKSNIFSYFTFSPFLVVYVLQIWHIFSTYTP